MHASSRIYRISCTVLLLLSWISISEAQRLSDRNLIINPLADSTSFPENKRVSVAHALQGWAGFGRYTGLSDDDHEWFHELGANIELIRFSNRSTLSIYTTIEFIADPFNRITFNPRAIWWSEGFIYSLKTAEDRFWQFSYHHRCKHDIDNLSIGEERTLIYGSFRAEHIRTYQLPKRREMWLSLGTDLYSILQDTRDPINPVPESLNQERLIASTSLKAHFLLPFKDEQVAWFVNTYVQPNLFGQEKGFTNRFRETAEFNVNAGVSTGLMLRGAAQIRLFLDYEYLNDTEIPIQPRHAHLLKFGIRGLSAKGIR